MSLRYLSVCSGIEAATVAWHPLGWSPVAFSEVDAFPSAVLKHHYPAVPNWGDMTKFQEWPDAAIDVLVGGTPCQSFSVAGLRKGLADPRGNLMLTYLAIAGRYRPRWLVWENVSGVLSSNGGRDFAALLGGLAELGYGFAYRVLDAQHFGVAQRRRRVFVVGHLGDWRRAAAVLFERASLSGHPAPRREAGQVAPTVPSRRTAGGGLGPDFDCDGGLIPQTVGALDTECGGNKITHQSARSGHYLPVAHSLRAEGFDASKDGTGRGTPLVPVDLVSVVPTMPARRGAGGFNGNGDFEHGGGLVPMAHAFDARQSDVLQYGDKTGPLDTHGSSIGVMRSMAVRRLTPTECARLQGFPDDYLDIPYRGKPAADGNKYKALGNSMAVPVMRWIGNRIAQVEAL